jgi:glyoxylase-like metal-dependent hydrolase (beta-lactamase superfamily II)
MLMGNRVGCRMMVRQIRVGRMANFVYLLVDERTREALVVDSGWETEPIVQAAEAVGATVKFVVATHGHFDHVTTIKELADRVGARVVAHADSPVECELRVRNGDELRLGGRAVKILHTPGHTEDSICLYDGENVFTGDTIFVGTIGKFDRERAEAIYRSLYEIILSLPESTVMYPGHDYGEVPFRTLGEERASNPYLLSKDLRSFLSLFG